MTTRTITLPAEHWQAIKNALLNLCVDDPYVSPEASDACDALDAALAQPEPEGPTDQEIADTFAQGCREGAGNPDQPPFLAGARAVLARFGRPAVQPVPVPEGWWTVEIGGRSVSLPACRPAIEPVAVSERWPEFSDCDQCERVWAWNPVLGHWKLTRLNRSIHTHWLPHHALPVPTSQEIL